MDVLNNTVSNNAVKITTKQHFSYGIRGETSNISNNYDLLYNGTWNLNGSKINQNQTDSIEDYTEYALSQYLFKIVPIILLVLGTVGNGLSFRVLRSRYMKSMCLAFYLACLAVTDTLVLYIGLSRHIIRVYAQYDIRESHAFVCKTQRFLLYSGLDYSAWILVAVTVERYISICHPFKASTMCTIKRAKLVLCIIVILVFAKNLHAFWTYDLIWSAKLNKSVCTFPNEAYRKFGMDVLPLFAFCVYAGGPFTTMLVLNILLIRELRRAGKYRQSMLTQLPVNGHGHIKKDKHDPHSKRAVALSLTVMLLVVTFGFLILASPSFINLIVEPYWKKTITTPHGWAIQKLVSIIVLILTYTNHSVNFLLYCVSSKRFRRVFLFLMCGKTGRDYSLTLKDTVHHDPNHVSPSRNGHEMTTLFTHLTPCGTPSLRTPYRTPCRTPCRTPVMSKKEFMLSL